MVQVGSSSAVQRRGQEQHRRRAWIRVHAAYERRSFAHEQLDVGIVRGGVPRAVVHQRRVEYSVCGHGSDETLQGCVLV